MLAFLLDQHPTRVTADELPSAFDARDFAEKDAIARALRELTAVGLLWPQGS